VAAFSSPVAKVRVDPLFIRGLRLGFLGGGAAPPGSPVEALIVPGAGGRILDSLEPVEALELAGTPFAWPAELAVPLRGESLAAGSLDGQEWMDFRAALVSDIIDRNRIDSLGDIGDALLVWPERLFDGVSAWIGSPSGRAPVRTWEGEDRSISGRMLDLQAARRHQRLSAVFLQQWTDRERKYFAEFEESRADTEGFRNQTEGADLHELGSDQRKILLDALRRTYLARYKTPAGGNLSEEAWGCGAWSGLDFAVLPPLMGGLLYLRGFNKRFSLGETALGVSFEPVSELLSRKHDRSAAAALEWTLKGFPVGVIATAGIHEGRYGLDFVGIGTSVGAARSAVELQHAPALR
jgi:hypothetical protein